MIGPENPLLRWFDDVINRAREAIAHSRNIRHAAHLRRALAAKQSARPRAGDGENTSQTESDGSSSPSPHP